MPESSLGEQFGPRRRIPAARDRRRVDSEGLAEGRADRPGKIGGEVAGQSPSISELRADDLGAGRGQAAVDAVAEGDRPSPGVEDVVAIVGPRAGQGGDLLPDLAGGVARTDLGVRRRTPPPNLRRWQRHASPEGRCPHDTASSSSSSWTWHVLSAIRSAAPGREAAPSKSSEASRRCGGGVDLDHRAAAAGLANSLDLTQPRPTAMAVVDSVARGSEGSCPDPGRAVGEGAVDPTRGRRSYFPPIGTTAGNVSRPRPRRRYLGGHLHGRLPPPGAPPRKIMNYSGRAARRNVVCNEKPARGADPRRLVPRASSR